VARDISVPCTEYACIYLRNEHVDAYINNRDRFIMQLSRGGGERKGAGRGFSHSEIK